MYKFFLLFFLPTSILFAKDIYPTKEYKSFGFVNDFVVDGGKLYAANDEGSVDIFDTKTQKLIEQIVLPPVNTAMGKLIAANILSVDRINNKTLLVSMGRNGFRNVWIYENNKLKQIVDESKKLTIKEARFVNNEQIIFGTFGSEIILHDTSEQYNLYKAHVSYSTLGDITLNTDKTKMILSDESGEIKLIDIKTSNIEKTYNSQNVDNVYRVAYANGVIITAGQDRRVAVYQNDKEDYHIKSNFLVYCVGLSPSGKTGIYSADAQNNLQVFNTQTKKMGDRLVGHNSLINQIKFISENELYSVGSRNKIFYWRLD
ncbi:nitrate reductase [Sulfurimonas lithotrophica]|uniref:Nitrate reductase n=1 Tax=Sulfurimonas lithotrophica TaxID=2590022 RepID=A0A5P8P2Q8_9BACT|nr:nitrate reductase [Sulfurimonas lithotrophica]QFR50033.1 nitrate reductase [Sulfurimonas lithotrophica]